MKRAAKFFLIPFLLLIVSQADAGIRWDEPEVVPEKLVKKNRRVIRFSGVTTPNALVRIRKNKVKLYLDNGKARWAKIPQKHRVQFPVKADRDGSFTFDLYLPTVPVEIPVQVNAKKRWRTSVLNFRVPDSGRAKRFKAYEESFTAQEDDLEKIEQPENYYSRKNDQGMVVQDKEGKQAYGKTTFAAWAGLGASYFSSSYNSSNQFGDVESSGSTLVLPTFRFGVDWDMSDTLLIKGAVRSTSGQTDDISGSAGDPVTGRDFTWLEVQTGVVWFMDSLKQKKGGHLGLDLGLQLQQLPYFRQREGVANFSYFDNNTYNLHIGVFYQTKSNKVWNYEIYGRYLYPISTGDTFDVDSAFPLFFEFGGGLKKRLTQSLSFGVFGQLNYFMTDTKYTNLDGGNNLFTTTSEMSLMLFTIDARIIANF